MSILLADFFKIISKELNQVKETGDSDSSYQYINSEDLPFYINEKIAELVEFNPSLFKREYLHEFSAETNIFVLPDIFHKILGYYDTFIGDWRLPADASNMDSDIRVIGDNSLYATTPWQKGDQLLLRVSEFPPEVTSESDAVVFKKQYMRLLRLEIIRTVLGNNGKGWHSSIEMEFQEKKKAFGLAGQSIQTVMRVRTSGSRLGN